MWCDWVPHISSISSKIPFNCSRSPICSLMNCTICDNCTLRSFRKACTEWTHDSHIAIASLASAILVVCSLSMLSVFSLLHGALSALLSSTQRVLISGKDNESPRKSGVASTVRSGASGTVFDIDTTGWSGRIHITAPVEWTTIWLAADDAHNAGHSPGAFPFVSATFIPFLLPICPNNLSHFALAFMHLLHICPGIPTQRQLFFLHKVDLTMCATDPDSSCMGEPSPILMSLLSLATNWWEHWAYSFVSLDNNTVIQYLPYAVSLTYVHLVHAPPGSPSPSPFLSLFHLLAVWSVWTTQMRLLCMPPLLAKLLLPAVFLPCIVWLLPPSIVIQWLTKLSQCFALFDCSLNNSGGQTPINKLLVYQWKHLLWAKRR